MNPVIIESGTAAEWQGNINAGAVAEARLPDWRRLRITVARRLFFLPRDADTVHQYLSACHRTVNSIIWKFAVV